jgi:hypothetical protein
MGATGLEPTLYPAIRLREGPRRERSPETRQRGAQVGVSRVRCEVAAAVRCVWSATCAGVVASRVRVSWDRADLTDDYWAGSKIAPRQTSAGWQTGPAEGTVPMR